MPKKQLHPTPVPAWLLNANASTKFNPTDVLQGSIYYPGCYVDGNPLQAYGGYAHSFVFPPSRRALGRDDEKNATWRGSKASHSLNKETEPSKGW